MTFNSDQLIKIVEHSQSYKIFEGVELHKDPSSLNARLFGRTFKKYHINYSKDKDGDIPLDQKAFNNSRRNYEIFSTLFTVGTDIAINNARDLACIKLPLSDDGSLNQVAQYLNSTNQLYFGKSKPFVWHMLMNNCTHLALNAVHKSGKETPFYNVEPYIDSGSLIHFAKALTSNRKNTIKNMMTPADGFQLLQKNLEGTSQYLQVDKSLSAVFETKDLKVFSFDALSKNEEFLKDLKQSKSEKSWLKRNVVFNNILFTKYKTHFYKIETLVKQK